MESKKTNRTDHSELSADHSTEDDYFIDDYSHLRLSYYQCRDLSSSGDSTYEPYGPDSESNNTMDAQRDKRRKLLEYFVSQIPEFPHPSHTAASIVASASKKVDKTSGFKYNNKIEQGNKANDDIVFTPDRRSTLIPNFK